jgi:hypothetical protein
MKKRFIYLIFAILLTGCTHTRYSPEIEDVLKQAGDNRSQLEKVLKRYSHNPADSLKLRAAEFLIVNMPDKYSVEYNVPFQNLMAYCIRMGGEENLRSVTEAYGPLEPVIKEDVKHITADYLINNIELAFKVWEEQPWGKNVPFDVFCEEILPYRIGNEPLENWREKVLASYARLNSSFKTQSGITAVEACSQVNLQLPHFCLSTDVPDMSYSMIMAATRGMCDEMVSIAIFVMRALGIPVTKDYTLKWPGRDDGHSWNSVYENRDRRIVFMGVESGPGQEPASHYMSGKIYRQTFAKQKSVNTGEANIPLPLCDQYMKDVTDEYLANPEDPVLYSSGGGNRVEIPVKYQPSGDTKYAWLASRGNKGWNIIGWGETDSKTVNFGAAGRNIMYLPLYYENGVQTPVHYPFTVHYNNRIQIFEPDTGNYRQLTVTEMSAPVHDLTGRMVHGIFEGANRSDFSGAEVLHTVKNIGGVYFHTAKIRNPKPYRYVRYVSPAGGYGNVAEIVLLNASGEKLSGSPFGSPWGSYADTTVTCEDAFDGDVLTFYDAAQPDGSWIGLDLGTPQTVAEIRYFPRNEGNCIYEGHTYELFYWEKDWRLFERQVATKHFLDFRIPAGGLYYLKSVTTGASTSWFTPDENGKQIWLNK